MNQRQWLDMVPTIMANFDQLLSSGEWTADNWYELWGTLVMETGARFGLEPLQACALFASMSPRKSIGRNWACYEQALYDGLYMVKELTRGNRDKAQAIISGAPEAPLQYLGNGRKTINFARALSGDSTAVPIDSITAQAGMNDRNVSRVNQPCAIAMELSVRHTARKYGKSPARTQEEIWKRWRMLKAQGWLTWRSDPVPAELRLHILRRPMPWLPSEQF